MNDPSEYKVYYQDENLFFKEMHGVNNLSLVKTTSYEDQYLLGGMTSAISVNQPEQLELSIDRSFIGFDPLFQYTGIFPIYKIILLNGGGKYSLENLYLNSYSAGFSVGELPRISAKFTSYGGELFYPNNELGSPSEEYFYDIPKLGSISITQMNSSGIYENINGNIFSFDYSIEMNRQPFFSIGQKTASVSSILPLKINFSMNSKLLAGEAVSGLSFSKINEKNYNFNISISGSGQSMIFPITNSRLISSEVVLSNENTAEIKTQFLGYYGL